MRVLFFLVALFFLNTSYAQDFAIRANYAGGTTITVDVSCTSGSCPTTSNFILDIVFGLKWLDSYSVSLSNPSGSYNITKSGGETVSGIYKYQAYFANNAPYNLPEDWTTGAWVTIASFDVSQTGTTALGMFEITESGFNASVDPNINIDGVDYTPTIGGIATSVPLPVDLIGFRVSSSDCGTNKIEWETASETENRGFVLQRSTNGFTWQAISDQKSKGTATEGLQTYKWEDSNFDLATSIYYRLQYESYSGEKSYSNVISIKNDCIGINHVISVFPNPTVDLVVITGEGVGKFELVNGIGQKILSFDFEKSKTINLTDYPEGVYLLMGEISGRLISQKIIKQ